MSYVIIMPFQLFKETHPLMFEKNVYYKRMLVNSLYVCGLSSIESIPHFFYFSFLVLLKCKFQCFLKVTLVIEIGSNLFFIRGGEGC